MKAINALRTMIVLSVLSAPFAWSAPTLLADDPIPLPSYSVLVYYDGSSGLAEIHGSILSSFAGNPNYLPVVETADPAQFVTAIAGHGPEAPVPIGCDYDVFIALTVDGAAAEQWAADVQAAGFRASYATFYPDPTGEHDFAFKMIKQYDITPPLPLPVP
jgi:hypothetical protein